MLQETSLGRATYKEEVGSSGDTHYLLYLMETDLISILENNANTTDFEISI